MKTLLKRSCLVALGCLALAAHQAQAITLDLSSNTGAQLRFNGDSTFQFNDAPALFGGFDFRISADDSDPLGFGLGPAILLGGNIGGVFTIGTVTTSGLTQTADVTGSGIFSINDGMGNLLTGDLTFENATTTGVMGGFNFLGDINLTNITFTGSNPSLQALASTGSGITTISFQTTVMRDLNFFKNNATSVLSFSGSVSSAAVPDGGSAVALLGIALVGVEGFRRKFKLA